MPRKTYHRALPIPSERNMLIYAHYMAANGKRGILTALAVEFGLTRARTWSIVKQVKRYQNEQIENYILLTSLSLSQDYQNPTQPTSIRHRS